MAIAGMHHVGLCVSDLQRALAYHGTTLGLRVEPFEVAPVVMAATARLLGLAKPIGRFEGAFLKRQRAASGGTAIDLYTCPDWPAVPAGTEPHRVGITRVGLLVQDFDGTLARTRASGHPPIAEPVQWQVPCVGNTRMAVCRDPEGSLIELIEAPPSALPGDGNALCACHVALNCADLDRSLAFYADALGMTVADRFGPTGVDAFAMALGLGTGATAKGCVLEGVDRASGRARLQLVEWLAPAPLAAAADGAQAFGRAGLVRFALWADDACETYRMALAKGLRFLAPPETLGVEGLGTFSIVMLLDPDGNIVEFISAHGPH